MISMMTIPIPMAITVPAGPATGRKVLPGIANTPQPTMQPKAMLHTSRGGQIPVQCFFLFCHASGLRFFISRLLFGQDLV